MVAGFNRKSTIEHLSPYQREIAKEFEYELKEYSPASIEAIHYGRFVDGVQRLTGNIEYERWVHDFRRFFNQMENHPRFRHLESKAHDLGTFGMARDDIRNDTLDSFRYLYKPLQSDLPDWGNPLSGIPPNYPQTYICDSCGGFANGEEYKRGTCSACDFNEYITGDSKMNKTTMIAIISDEVIGVTVTFDGNDRYTYKSFDSSIKVDDYVIVPAGFDLEANLVRAKADVKKIIQSPSGNFKVCRVISVDDDIPIEGTVSYKWIVAKFDLDSYLATLQKEKEVVDEMLKIEKSKKKREIREEYKTMLGQDADKLIKLASPSDKKDEKKGS